MTTLNIVALSDVHLRSNNPVSRKDYLPKIQFRKLRFVFDYAAKHNCIILQAGDFADKSRDWDLLSILLVFFRKYSHVKFACCLGQHDNYYYSSTKGTTMGILERMKYIKVLSHRKPWQVNGWNIWGSSWGQPLPQPQPLLSSGNHILVTHRAMYPPDVYLYPGQNVENPDTFMMDHPEYQLVIVGDIHRSFYRIVNERHIANTGPLLRAESTQYNMDVHEPHFYHYTLYSSHIDRYKKVAIPHKDSYEVLSRTHIADKQDEVNIDALAHIIASTSITSLNKKLFKKIFNDSSIRPRIRKHLKEIYKNAS